MEKSSENCKYDFLFFGMEYTTRECISQTAVQIHLKLNLTRCRGSSMKFWWTEYLLKSFVNVDEIEIFQNRALDLQDMLVKSMLKHRFASFLKHCPTHSILYRCMPAALKPQKRQVRLCFRKWARTSILWTRGTESHCAVSQTFGCGNCVTFHFVFYIYLEMHVRVHFENS